MNNKLSQQTQDLLETISITAGDLNSNAKYISDLISKLRLEVTLTLGAMERAINLCVCESENIAKVNQQLIRNLQEGV